MINQESPVSSIDESTGHPALHLFTGKIIDLLTAISQGTFIGDVYVEDGFTILVCMFVKLDPT